MIPKYRIGKDINIKWEILVNGQIQDLSAADLTIILRDPNGKSATVSAFGVRNNIISFVLRGTSFHALGTYMLTLWMNKGKKGQTMLDKRDAFALVRYTDQEEDSDDNIIITDSSLNLTGNLSYIISDTSGGIPDDYVTDGELEEILQDFINEEDLVDILDDFVMYNDISTFATTNDISVFTTKNDISNFIESDNLPENIVEKQDISTFITKNDVSNFVTNNDVSNFVTKSDISTYSNTFVVTLTKWNNVYEADKSVAEINAAFDQGMQVIAKWHFPSQWDTEYYMTCRRTGGGAYIIYMSTAYDITLGNDQELIGKGIKFLLQTNSGIKEYVCKFEDYAKISDISTFITRQDVSNCITEIKTINGQSLVGTGNIVISSDTPIQPLVAGDHIDITNNTISVTGMPTKTSDLTNDSGFLSAVPAEYITRNQLNSSLSDFYNKTYIDSKFDLYVTKTALNSSLSNYYTKSEMNTSLGNFYNKTWLNNKFNSYYTKTEINEVLGDIQNLLESI